MGTHSRGPILTTPNRRVELPPETCRPWLRAPLGVCPQPTPRWVRKTRPGAGSRAVHRLLRGACGSATCDALAAERPWLQARAADWSVCGPLQTNPFVCESDGCPRVSHGQTWPPRTSRRLPPAARAPGCACVCVSVRLARWPAGGATNPGAPLHDGSLGQARTARHRAAVRSSSQHTRPWHGATSPTASAQRVL